MKSHVHTSFFETADRSLSLCPTPGQTPFSLAGGAEERPEGKTIYAVLAFSNTLLAILVDRFKNNVAMYHVSDIESKPYFQRKTTGLSLISSRYNMIRSFSSCLEDTRMPRNIDFVILAKNISIRLIQEPCLGVKMNSNRFGALAKYARVSLEVCAE